MRSRWVVTTCGTLLVILGLVFNHWTRRPKGGSAVSVAVREGAVSVNVPNDGAGVER